MNITEKRIAEIRPYEKNPRKNDGAVEYVANSIREFGFKVPIVIDADGVIVCGHTRYKAAQKLGIDVVPCVVADDLTPEQIKAFRLADNKTAEKASWDESLLFEELAGLDFDMSEFGFDMDEQPEEEPEITEDEYNPELPEEPKAKRGDVYRLGDHILMCGDSTRPDDVEMLTGGAAMDLCVTDPPYNINIEEKAAAIAEHGANARIEQGTYTGVDNDNMSGGEFNEFLRRFYEQMLRSLKPGGAFYVWHCEWENVNFTTALEAAGGRVRQRLIWNKNHFSLCRQDYQWKHEPCIYGWKDGAPHYFVDDRTQTTVIEDKLDVNKLSKAEMRDMLKAILDGQTATSVINEDKPMRSELHPTMKPVKLIARQIVNSSRRGESVIDFFGGSGTTLIACEQLGRKCYMMEYSPRYVDVIIERWEQLTGKKAVKIS